jgi:hypothetical protein
MKAYRKAALKDIKDLMGRFIGEKLKDLDKKS